MHDSLIAQTVNALNEPVCIFNVHGSLLSFNDHAKLLFGMSLDDEVLNGSGKYFTDESWSLIDSWIQSSLHEYCPDDDQAVRFITITCIHTSGARFRAECSLSCIYAHDSESPVIILVMRKKKKKRTCLYQHILDELPISVYTVDSQNTIQFANRVYCDVYGKSKEEIEGRSILEFIENDETLAKANKAMRRYANLPPEERAKEKPLIEPGSFFKIEKTLPSGKKHDVNGCVEFMYSDTGEIDCFIMSVTEISPRERELEGRLDELRENYEAILDSLPEGIYETDMGGAITYASKGYADMYGVDPKEMIGRHSSEFVLDSYPTKFYYIDENDEMKDVVFNHRFHYENDDIISEMQKYRETIVEKQLPGRNIYFKVNTGFRFDKNGKPFRMIISGTNVTKMVELEQSVKKKEERYRSLFKNSPIALIEVDTTTIREYLDSSFGKKPYYTVNSGRDMDTALLDRLINMIEITAANDSACKLFCVNSEKSENEKCQELKNQIIGPENIEVSTYFLELLLALDYSGVYETKIIDKQGNQKQVQIRYNNPLQTEGSFEHGILSIIDITEMKSAEKSLQIAFEEIEKIVSGHTADLELEMQNHRNDQKSLELSWDRVKGLMVHIQDAAERERRVISEELMAGFSQRISSLDGLLRNIKNNVEDRAKLAHDTRKVGSEIQSLIRRLQDVVEHLRPSALDQLGFVPAVLQMAQNYSSQHSIEIESDLGDNIDFQDDKKKVITVYRIIEGIMTSVIRYCRADKAAIHLERDIDDSNNIVNIIKIIHNGCIIEEAGRNEPNFDLYSIKHRAKAAGGDLVQAQHKNGKVEFAITVPDLPDE